MNAGELVWVDGEPQPHIPAHDRGLQFGDGLFETLAVIDGRIAHWPRHRARLQRGCRTLELPEPAWPALEQELHQAAAGQGRAVLKLIHTGGSSSRGYARPATPAPRRVLLRSAWPARLERHSPTGLRLAWCRHRLSSQPRLAGVKHLNRLDQVLARRELQGADIDEGLVCNQAGRVIEGVASNLFLVREGALHTPLLEDCGVAGVMREHIMETAAAAGIAVHETRLDPADVHAAEELFLCNSLMGLRPVTRLADHCYEPGPVTRRLLDLLTAETA